MSNTNFFNLTANKKQIVLFKIIKVLLTIFAILFIIPMVSLLTIFIPIYDFNLVAGSLSFGFFIYLALIAFLVYLFRTKLKTTYLKAICFGVIVTMSMRLIDFFMYYVQHLDILIGVRICFVVMVCIVALVIVMKKHWLYIFSTLSAFYWSTFLIMLEAGMFLSSSAHVSDASVINTLVKALTRW